MFASSRKSSSLLLSKYVLRKTVSETAFHPKMMKFTDLNTILPCYCYSVFADKYTKLGIELDAVFFLSLTDVLSAFSFLRRCKIGHDYRFYLSVINFQRYFPKYFSMHKAKRSLILPFQRLIADGSIMI